jgi:hypothetical protein
MEEIQWFLEEANGMMHEDLNTRLGNVALTEGAGGSETAPTADTGQEVDFAHGADAGQRAGGHEQVRTHLNSVLLISPSETNHAGQEARL